RQRVQMREELAVAARRVSLLRAVIGRAPIPNDGPQAPRYFWWRNERHDLTPRLYQVVAYLWNDDRWNDDLVQAEGLIQNVWGDEGEGVAESTARSTISRLNTFLNMIGVPWQYHWRSGQIFRE